MEQQRHSLVRNQFSVVEERTNRNQNT